MPADPASHLDAFVFDLDGVITDTASLHFRAWKRIFDPYLEERDGDGFAPFTTEDYRRYVDGKPRYDGAESFLRSRGISVPRGASGDAPDADTVCGLGNRKNRRYHELLKREGVKPFPDAVALLRRARRAGLRTAVVSSSRNGAEVVGAAGVEELFDASVDGTDLRERGLEGKPSPDLFLEAARHLEVEPARAAVFEDARAGVEAGRRGGFGLVVGVARDDGRDELKAAGAHRVVKRLDEIDPGDRSEGSEE